MINTLRIYSLQKVKNIEGKNVNCTFSLIIVLKVITNHYYFHCIFNSYIVLLFIPIIKYNNIYNI